MSSANCLFARNCLAFFAWLALAFSPAGAEACSALGVLASNSRPTAAQWTNAYAEVVNAVGETRLLTRPQLLGLVDDPLKTPDEAPSTVRDLWTEFRAAFVKVPEGERADALGSARAKLRQLLGLKDVDEERDIGRRPAVPVATYAIPESKAGSDSFQPLVISANAAFVFGGGAVFDLKTQTWKAVLQRQIDPHSDKPIYFSSRSPWTITGFKNGNRYSFWNSETGESVRLGSSPIPLRNPDGPGDNLMRDVRLITSQAGDTALVYGHVHYGSRQHENHGWSLYDVSSGMLRAGPTNFYPKPVASQVALSADGKIVWAVSGTGLMEWDSSIGLHRVLSSERKGHDHSLAPSAAGDILGFTRRGLGGTELVAFDLKAQQPRGTFQDVGSGTFSRDGRWYVGTKFLRVGSQIWLYDLVRGQAHLLTPSGDHSPLIQIGFSNSSDRLLISAPKSGTWKVLSYDLNELGKGKYPSELP